MASARSNWLEGIPLPLPNLPLSQVQEAVGGRAKVRTEWSLITLAYNLKRVLNLVRFQKLLLAVS